ncbi:unnamed protein product [Prorocentrum cordatum]|uniref:ATP-dependent RNA helicase n=1 Tax=Prorocentrum cordatum TaxID=2364126 RepID=A0ABN9RNU4_9DINO|nr:unnamed protein product [Polarella glacialis]
MFSSLFEHLHTLVLDEADRLLSLGFLDEIKEIISYLPAMRRSMLFSATMSDSVMDVAVRCCRGNYKYVDCVDEAEAATATAVAQSYVSVPGHQCLPVLYNLLMNEMVSDPFGYKVIVFFATARLTMFMARFFRQQLHIPVQEIHRRRDAAARQAAQGWFRAGQSGILFSSDVSARGMDYPNVSLVVQLGAPPTRDMYIRGREIRTRPPPPARPIRGPGSRVYGSMAKPGGAHTAAAAKDGPGRQAVDLSRFPRPNVGRPEAEPRAPQVRGASEEGEFEAAAVGLRGPSRRHSEQSVTEASGRPHGSKQHAPSRAELT